MIIMQSPLVSARRTTHRASALPVQHAWPNKAHLLALLTLAGTIASRPVEAQTHSRLVLQIHSIKCVDESNGKYMERIGGDEIVLSGVIIDATGRARRATTLRAGKFDKDGETRTYSPPRAFHTFDLTSGPDYPRTFRTMFVVVERDEGGGFQAVVNALVDKANAVAQAPTNGNGAGAELINTALTAAASSEDPRAALAKVLTEEAAKQITKKLKDDIFPPLLAELRVRSATAWISRTGSTTAVKTVRTKAHGGRYEIKYSWRVE